MSEAYDRFLALVKARHTCRGFKNDPVPEGAIEKILEAARWAMSGANSQPWEFIVVRNPETIRALYKTYQDEINDLNFWLEQRFPWDLRHPGFRIEGDLDAQYQTMNARVGWSEAPALIVVLGDGRRQRGSVSGASTPGRHQTHLTDGLSNASMILHLAAAALGLASQWVSIHIQEPFKQILDAGAAHAPHDHPRRLSEAAAHRQLPAQAAGDRARRALRPVEDDEQQDIVNYLHKLRASTIRTYCARAAKRPAEAPGRLDP
jgi:nitroreductase